MIELISTSQADAIRFLLPTNPDKDTHTRINRYINWLRITGRQWLVVDLIGYKGFLENDPAINSDQTISAYLSAVRTRYSELQHRNDFRDWLYKQTTGSMLERKAIVEEILTRIENAIRDRRAYVKVRIIQDYADSDHLRLSVEQQKSLIKAPGLNTLRGIRDTALIALLLSTGLRKGEAVALVMDDLRQTMGGELAVRVRDGKGMKQRLVPYGVNDWCLVYVDLWMLNAGITDSVVFRGFYKSSHTVRSTALSSRHVDEILKRYPIVVGGRQIIAQPHDLRRSYARREYEAGTDIVSIQQNLGHADLKTTQRYIGTLDASARRSRGNINPF